jgi:hypothetical protein
LNPKCMNRYVSEYEGEDRMLCGEQSQIRGEHFLIIWRPHTTGEDDLSETIMLEILHNSANRIMTFVSVCGFGLVKFSFLISKNRGFDLHIMNSDLLERFGTYLWVYDKLNLLLC